MTLGCAASGPIRSVEDLPEIIDDQQLAEVITAMQGKVFLIHVWATWCVPCRREFPIVSEVARIFKPAQVQILSLSLDEPNLNSVLRALSFSRTYGSTLKPVVVNSKARQLLKERLGRSWNGAIPALFVYNTSGRLVAQRLGLSSGQEICDLVSSALPPGT